MFTTGVVLSGFVLLFKNYDFFLYSSSCYIIACTSLSPVASSKRRFDSRMYMLP
jgi:hypothetical protein